MGNGSSKRHLGEQPSPSSGPAASESKQKQVVLHKVIELHEDGDDQDVLSTDAAASGANSGSSQNYVADVVEKEANLILANKLNDMNLSTGVELKLPSLKNAATEEPRKNKKRNTVEDEIDMKYKSFKQFDTVQGHSDNHFSNSFENINYSKEWVKRIKHEWEVLEKNLPETIYVRIYENRMDIMRAVIIGPAGTPYHDGLFFFDAYFPTNYPQVPPLLHFHSGGLRLNPNLYVCGRVCLSLLNTWSGRDCELWRPPNSTMLQVLVSIQGLVLNEKPYFNEPGYAATVNTEFGKRNSLAYNDNAFLLSCKTMLYSLRKPPMHFGDFVAGHFRCRGRAILLACKAYMNGTPVGSTVGEAAEDANKGPQRSSSAAFKKSLLALFEVLLMEFTNKGADCDEFLDKTKRAEQQKLQ